MYKQSAYNFIWPVSDNEGFVIYNSFTGAMMELDNKYQHLLSEKLDMVNELDCNEEQKKVFDELVRCGFIIEDYIDELKVIKYRNNKSKYNRDTLYLTILPTFRCNLRCFYCFQDRDNNGLMSAEVQEGILQFVLKNIQGVKNIEVLWFGGEPLMAWDIIMDLTHKLKELAKNHNCTYKALMVTNGYLFKDDYIDKLKELDIDTIQITLDGTPELHSKRKGIKGDPEQNFQFILDVIRKLLKVDIHVRLRVNIDKSNHFDMNELLDILSRAGIAKAAIYPAMIEPYTKLCSNVEGGCFNRDEFVDVELQFYQSMLQRGLIKDFRNALPKLRTNSCTIDSISSYSIAPDGFVYKCWNTIGDPKEQIGDVLNREQTETSIKKMRMNRIINMTWDPLERAECVECKLLPVCMGGCPHRSIHNGGLDCLPIKDNIKDIVFNHIYSNKINKIFS